MSRLEHQILSLEKLDGFLGQHPMIWTRGEEDCIQDLLLWRRLAKCEPILVPCIQTVPLDETAILRPRFKPGDTTYTVIVTSPRAVTIVDRSAALRPYLSQARLCITHGAKTAELLQQAGYNTQLVRNVRTARELANWMTDSMNRREPVLFISPLEPAFNLVEFLTQEGFKAESLVCYKTLPGVPANQEKTLTYLLSERAIQKKTIWCFASPTAIKGLMATVQRLGLEPPRPYGVAVIGPTTAAAASSWFEKITISPENTVESLITTANGLKPDALLVRGPKSSG